VGKVLDATGSGTFGDVQAGIDWCVAIGARTISMSLGGGLFSSACDGAADPTGTAAHVNAAAAAGVLVVSAAGNDRAANAVSTPACASGSMAVGATYDANIGRASFSGCTDRTTAPDKICCFSNRSVLLDVVAPGCIISSAYFSGTNQVVGQCGTSQATPHVAGLGALLRQQDPGATAGAIRARIEGTAVDLGAAGFDTTYGEGRIDVTAALVAAAAACGNGIAEAGEACDGTDLRGETCASQGFDAGVLACAAGCTLDTSGCTVTSCVPLNKGRCNCDGSCSNKELSWVAGGGVCADCP
jgi:subtilisin family serine protease